VRPQGRDDRTHNVQERKPETRTGDNERNKSIPLSALEKPRARQEPGDAWARASVRFETHWWSTWQPSPGESPGEAGRRGLASHYRRGASPLVATHPTPPHTNP